MKTNTNQIKMKSFDIAMLLILLFGLSSCYDRFYVVNPDAQTKDYIRSKDRIRFVTFGEDNKNITKWVVRIEVENIQEIEVLIQNKGGRNQRIKRTVNGTIDSIFHILNTTGQQRSTHEYQVKIIKLKLKKDQELHRKYFYGAYLSNVTDSTIVVASGKKLVPFKDPAKQVEKTSIKKYLVSRGSKQVVKTFRRPTNAKGLEFDFQNVVGKKDGVEHGDIQVLEVRRYNGEKTAIAIIVPITPIAIVGLIIAIGGGVGSFGGF